MPFDQEVVEALDNVRDLFGPNGEGWIKSKGSVERPDGSIGRCIATAIASVSFNTEVMYRVRNVLTQTAPIQGLGLIKNNDLASDFTVIAAWLDRARKEKTNAV